MKGARIGACRLVRPLGRGGMGVVWCAEHDSGEEVALKWLIGEAAAHPNAVQSFLDEARAAASMDHPGIVRVFDLGQVPEGSPAAPAGAPYLVMELLRDGPPRLPMAGWAEVRRLLLSVLDALAHAHARGLVHRDLKPGNIIRGGRFKRYKLVDFGLAIHRGVEESRATGTAIYMAPEQLTASWRDFGPATDLWAVGCLAWEAVTGMPPFGHGDYSELRWWVQQRDPGELVPLFGVPDGFEDWVRRLLEKDPHGRCDRAAAAAAALLALAEPEDAPTTTWERDDLAVQGAATFAWDAAPVAGPIPVSSSTSRFPAPPIPEDWRPPASFPEPRPSQLGLGLYALRAPRMAGRRSERDRLWSALREVVRTGGSRAIRLCGPVGSGRTRLASWLAERSHELGVASVVDVVSGSAVPLREAFARTWSTHGLDEAAAAKRIARASPRLGGAAGPLGRWLAEAQGAPGLDEALSLLIGVLRVEGGRRPFVVLVDESGDCPMATELCVRALASTDPPRVLWLLVGDTGPGEAIHLGPLPPDERLAQVDSLLPLESGVAALVRDRTRGWPLFARQLVDLWIQQGALVPGPDGYVLESWSDSLPTDLATTWDQRFDALLSTLPAGAQDALLAAAVLGDPVDRAQWRALVGSAAPLPRVERALLTNRLAGPAPSGFRFAHPLARQVLLQRDPERAAHWHLEVARTSTDPGIRGQHLILGGRPQEALDPLLATAQLLVVRSEHYRALDLLRDRERGVRLAGLETPEVEAPAVALEAYIYVVTGDYSTGAAYNERARALAEEAGDGWALGSCAFTDALIAQSEGRLHAAIDAFAESARIYAEIGDETNRIWSEINHARLLAYADPDQAIRRLQEQHRELAGTPYDAGVARALSSALLRSGRYQEAETVARDMLQQVGLEAAGAHAEGLLAVRAMCASMRGDHAEAIALGETAIARLRSVGAPIADVVIQELNLAVSLWRAGQYPRALALAAAGAVDLRRRGQPRLELSAEALALASAAGCGEWGRCQTHLERLEALASGVQGIEPETVEMLEWFVARAAPAGESLSARAEQVLRRIR